MYLDKDLDSGSEKGPGPAYVSEAGLRLDPATVNKLQNVVKCLAKTCNIKHTYYFCTVFNAYPASCYSSFYLNQHQNYPQKVFCSYATCGTKIIKFT